MMSLVFLLVVVGAIVMAARVARREGRRQIEGPTEQELLDAIEHWDDE